MEQTIVDEKYGTITYAEAAWSGKSSLIVNNVPLFKLNRTEFKLDENTIIKVKGYSMIGVKLLIGEDTIKIVKPMNIIDIIFSMFPFLFIEIWASYPQTVKIFPMVGGALGGLIGGIAVYINAHIIRNIKNFGLRILAYIGVIAAASLISFILALIVIAMMSEAQK